MTDGTVLVLLGTSPWEGPYVAGLAHPSSRVGIARRCLDTADLLASAASGLGRVALVGADAPRLDGDVVARLRELAVGVVGVAAVDDPEGAQRLGRWGVREVVVVDGTALPDAVRRTAAAVARHGSAAPPAPSSPAHDEAEPGGTCVVVWGPTGAPGRTSVAVAVADEAAREGLDVLLVDADTWGPSLTLVLGVVDEGAGLASACRRALAGGLDPSALRDLTRALRPGLAVLPGLPRAGRWTEARSAAIAEVLAVARSAFDLVVVDCGFSLESDEELVFDTAAPRRNAATFAALESADVVLAVGSADPVGLVRLVGGLDELTDAVPGTRREVVVTRLRPALVGSRGEASVASALHRHAGVEQVWCVPDDRAAYDLALRSGSTLAEVAPSSPARAALRGLTRSLLRDLGLTASLSLRAAAGTA